MTAPIIETRVDAIHQSTLPRLRALLLRELGDQAAETSTCRTTISALTGQTDVDSQLEREIAEASEKRAEETIAAIEAGVGILWNVITVSLRQTIIPPSMLGRVNSVYRFFAWGMMPIGAAIGGLTVVVVSTFADREWALRSTWLVSAAIHIGLFLFGRSKLTTAKIEAARAEGVNPSQSAS